MYLGDNLIMGGITDFVAEFQKNKPNAQILLARVDNPSDFGVAELSGGTGGAAGGEAAEPAVEPRSRRRLHVRRGDVRRR